MKNRINITTLALALLAIVITTSGCIGPYYSNKNQYDKGRWHWWADNQSVYQRDQQMLAVGKLNAQPVMTGVMTSTGIVATAVAPAPGTAPAGYKGFVANLSSYRRYTLTVRGTENKSYYLGPGQKVTDYLLPGRYVATANYGGRVYGTPYFFDVGPQIMSFQGEACHWFLVAEW